MSKVGVRNVCDGDLLLTYLRLSADDQTEIAKDVGSTPFEISKMLTSFDAYI